MPVSVSKRLMKVSRNGAMALSWNEPMVIWPLAFLAPPVAAPDFLELLPQPASQPAPTMPAAPSAPRSMAWRRVKLLPSLISWPLLLRGSDAGGDRRCVVLAGVRQRLSRPAVEHVDVLRQRAHRAALADGPREVGRGAHV